MTELKRSYCSYNNTLAGEKCRRRYFLEESARDVKILPDTGIELSIPSCGHLSLNPANLSPDLSSPGSQRTSYYCQLPHQQQRPAWRIQQFLALLITHEGIKLCFTGFLFTSLRNYTITLGMIGRLQM